MSEWDEWKERQLAKNPIAQLAAKGIREFVAEAKKEYRIPTEHELHLAKLLNYHVTFLPGSYDKRFARNMDSTTQITDAQAACLEKMFHRYRRQIPNHEQLCSICGNAGG